MSQPYTFGFTDTALAEAGHVPLDQLHRDARAIVHCCDAIRPVAERLGVAPPVPRLPGFSYLHVTTLGAELLFAEGSEPNVVPLLKGPEAIDRLREPEDYLAAGVVPQRLRLLEELRDLRPDTVVGIGHLYEGPVTTAVLLMGPDFLTLPFEDPERAHRLLDFCVTSALRFARLLLARLGKPQRPGGWVGISDDFAGMFSPALFDEFVVPYWDRLYAGRQPGHRWLHSELLKVEHLARLAGRADEYDPRADQYLTPALLRRHCPVPFDCAVLSWHVRDYPADRLVAYYREIAANRPAGISISMEHLSEEPKLSVLLETARTLADGR